MPYTPTLEFEEGANNKLPQVFNPTISASNEEPQVRIVVSAEPHVETAHGRRGDPQATTATIAMSWTDAVRLAVEIAKMAEATGVTLPPGTLLRGKMH